MMLSLTIHGVFMSGVSKAVSDAVYEKAMYMLKESARSGDVSRKLQAIKSAKEHGIQKVAQVFGISRVALMSWIKAFERNGIEGLKLQSGRGRQALISQSEKVIIQGWILDDCNVTIKAVKLRIEAELKKSLSMAATHRLMKSLNLSYITPRAKHYKQDGSVHDDFKKN